MSLPTCTGERRLHVCALCGRPPGERCPRTPYEVVDAPDGQPVIVVKRCPACDGTGFWPKTSETECLVCKGTGRWNQ